MNAFVEAVSRAVTRGAAVAPAAATTAVNANASSSETTLRSGFTRTSPASVKLGQLVLGDAERAQQRSEMAIEGQLVVQRALQLREPLERVRDRIRRIRTHLPHQARGRRRRERKQR